MWKCGCGVEVEQEKIIQPTEPTRKGNPIQHNAYGLL